MGRTTNLTFLSATGALSYILKSRIIDVVILVRLLIYRCETRKHIYIKPHFIRMRVRIESGLITVKSSGTNEQ